MWQLKIKNNEDSAQLYHTLDEMVEYLANNANLGYVFEFQFIPIYEQPQKSPLKEREDRITISGEDVDAETILRSAVEDVIKRRRNVPDFPIPLARVKE